LFSVFFVLCFQGVLIMRLHLLLRPFGLILVGAILLTTGVGNLAMGASIPFVENFSGAAPDFLYSSSNANVTATVGSDVLTIAGAPGTGGQALNALVNINNANNASIVMKTDFKITDWLINGNGSAGFLAFSTNPAAGALPSGANSGYLADIVLLATGGSIRILDLSNGLATVASGALPTNALVANETYQLTFTATPAGVGLLDLSLTIEDTVAPLVGPGGILTISSAAPVAASTGTFFGYRHRVGNSGGASGGSQRTLDAEYDNFSIVPEPNSFVMFGIASTAFGLFRWRKRSYRK
jgi:hypothetical protein